MPAEGLQHVIVQGFAAKDECPPTAALHYEVFVRLLHLVEQRRNGQCNMPPARLVGAAALFELLDGRQSVRWVCQRSPFGEVRDGAGMQRVHRLAMIMRSEAALHRWVMLPTLHTEINHLSISMRRIVDQAATEMVHTIWFTPEPISTQLLVTPLTSPLSQPSAPAPSHPHRRVRSGSRCSSWRLRRHASAHHCQHRQQSHHHHRCHQQCRHCCCCHHGAPACAC